MIKYFKKKITPIIYKAIELGIPVIVLTNSPEDMKVTAADQNMTPKMKEMAKSGSIAVVFHDACDENHFSEMLNNKGIKNLIYTGFSSTDCILARRLGVVMMSNKGFNIFLCLKLLLGIMLNFIR